MQRKRQQGEIGWTEQDKGEKEKEEQEKTYSKGIYILNVNKNEYSKKAYSKCKQGIIILNVSIQVSRVFFWAISANFKSTSIQIMQLTDTRSYLHLRYSRIRSEEDATLLHVLHEALAYPYLYIKYTTVSPYRLIEAFSPWYSSYNQ